MHYTLIALSVVFLFIHLHKVCVLIWSNIVNCFFIGFSATPGWDPVTGLGSIDFCKFKAVFSVLPAIDNDQFKLCTEHEHFRYSVVNDDSLWEEQINGVKTGLWIGGTILVVIFIIMRCIKSARVARHSIDHDGCCVNCYNCLCNCCCSGGNNHHSGGIRMKQINDETNSDSWCGKLSAMFSG